MSHAASIPKKNDAKVDHAMSHLGGTLASSRQNRRGTLEPS
jgi:hypothetical protein